MQSFDNPYPYTLVEAAEHANCNPQDLLHFAAHGYLALLVRVPDDVFLRLYIDHPNTWEIGNKHTFKPEFLALIPSYCLQIELNGITEQCDFWEGYLFGKNGSHHQLPSDECRTIDPRLLHWRTYTDTWEKRLKLTVEKLFVMRGDLTRLIETTFHSWHSNGKTILAKNYYSIDEAAAIANGDLQKILNYAALGRIKLITGVPYNVNLIEYNDNVKIERHSFLPKPQILALMQTHCKNINTPREHERCDFKDGFFINSSGQMDKVSHQYERAELNHEKYYWRAFQDGAVKHLNLPPKCLFVLRADLNKLLELEAIANLSNQLMAENENKGATHASPDISADGEQVKNTKNPCDSLKSDKPWEIIDPSDPLPMQDWYTPARFFAREILKTKPHLLNNRMALAENVHDELKEHKIYKRGGKVPPDSATILKAFSNCNFKE